MTAFGVRSSLRSAAAKRIEAAGRAFAEKERSSAIGNRQSGSGRSANGELRIANKDEKAPHHSPLATRHSLRSPGACHRIIEEVSRKHDIPVKDILSDRRARVLIPARHEAIYRCVNETPLSLPAIGRVFHRDHTSIGHAVMRHHLTTGDPLPRGMDWQAGRRKRRPISAREIGSRSAEVGNTRLPASGAAEDTSTFGHEPEPGNHAAGR